MPKDPSEVIDEESIFSILEDIQRMREEKQQQVQVEVPKECQKMPPKPTPKKRVMKEKVPKQYTKKTQTKVVKFVPAPTHNPFIQPGTVRRK